jgi:hypothetical protein
MVRGDSKTSAPLTVHLVLLPVNDGRKSSNVLVITHLAI